MAAATEEDIEMDCTEKHDNIEEKSTDIEQNMFPGSVESEKISSVETKKEDCQIQFKMPTFKLPSSNLKKSTTDNVSSSPGTLTKVNKDDSSARISTFDKQNSRDGETSDSNKVVTLHLVEGGKASEIESRTTSDQRQNLNQPDVSTNSNSSSQPKLVNSSPPPVPYKEPQWSGVPESTYTLDVLKNGCIHSQIALNNRPYHVFGRLVSCDVVLEHPSVSRYHAVLQYRAFSDDDHPQGFYLYDLKSTHGTFQNKCQLTPKTYYRVRVGHMFKVGGSSRLYILQGPEEDADEESELTVTEIKELRQKQLEKLEALEKVEDDKKDVDEETEMVKKVTEEDSGIDWGMGVDASEEDTGDNPYATMEFMREKDPLDLKDPKKTLRGYFEREGEELEYEVDERGLSHAREYICRVRLPIEDASGNSIYAEASVTGKKKEAVIACAVEACRILDGHGVLRQSTHESKKKKSKKWEDDDYYDSDDDTFLDRTGIIEKKRLQRMKKAGKEETVVETYDSLMSKFTEVESQITSIEQEIEEQQSESTEQSTSTSYEDSLDAFMQTIKSGSRKDKVSRSKLKLKLYDLRKDRLKLQKLMKVAKPTALPELKKSPVAATKRSTDVPKSFTVGRMPMVGTMKKSTISFKKFKSDTLASAVKTVSSAPEEDEEDDDDDEEEGVVKETPTITTSDLSSTATEENCNKDDNLTHVSSSEPMVDMTTVTAEDAGDEEEKVKEIKSSPEKTKECKESKRSTKKPVTKLPPVQYDQLEEDDTYAAWMPPVGQTGDGKTHLNDKYGY